jgi:tRNA G18 (ribose-2'-O)-methylase SpoU
LSADGVLAKDSLGTMVTDRYQHETSQSWFSGGRSESLPVDGIDNLPGSVPLESFGLPRRCVLLFGQEGPGLSRGAHEAASAVCSIGAVRVHPVHQRRRSGRDRDAHLDTPARGSGAR